MLFRSGISVAVAVISIIIGKIYFDRMDILKKLNAVEDGAGNCIVSVRDIGYKFELNKENEQQ